ncbi:MAG: hypothetical protein AB1420_01995 [Bacillota bacterium]
MNKISVLVIFFQGIPESIALMFLIFVLLRVPISWRKIMLLGIAEAVAVYLIRLLPVAFGVHTILLIVFATILIVYVTREDLLKVITSVLPAFFFLVFYEVVSFTVQMKIIELFIPGFSDSFYTVPTNTWVLIGLGLFHVMLMFITGSIILHYRRKKQDKTLEKDLCSGNISKNKG